MLYASIYFDSKDTVNHIVRIGQVFISPIVSTSAIGEKVPILKSYHVADFKPFICP